MSISSNSFNFSSTTMTSTGSNISLNSNNLNDNNYFDRAQKLLTGRLNDFRDKISQTLLTAPQGFSSLSAFISDFSFFYGYNPSERARSFGYFSLYEFLKSDYMKGRVFLKICVNGELFLFPKADENTRAIFNQIVISYEQRNERNKRKEWLRRQQKRRTFY